MAARLAPALLPYLINGLIAPGGQIFTYAAGTLTKQATYIDSSMDTQFTDPIILNAGGFPQDSSGNPCAIWLDPTLTYKFVFSPSSDSDPPTNPVWTLDDITAPGS